MMWAPRSQVVSAWLGLGLVVLLGSRVCSPFPVGESQLSARSGPGEGSEGGPLSGHLGRIEGGDRHGEIAPPLRPQTPWVAADAGLVESDAGWDPVPVPIQPSSSSVAGGGFWPGAGPDGSRHQTSYGDVYAGYDAADWGSFFPAAAGEAEAGFAPAGEILGVGEPWHDFDLGAFTSEVLDPSVSHSVVAGAAPHGPAVHGWDLSPNRHPVDEAESTTVAVPRDRPGNGADEVPDVRPPVDAAAMPNHLPFASELETSGRFHETGPAPDDNNQVLSDGVSAASNGLGSGPAPTHTANLLSAQLSGNEKVQQRVNHAGAAREDSLPSRSGPLGNSEASGLHLWHEISHKPKAHSDKLATDADEKPVDTSCEETSQGEDEEGSGAGENDILSQFVDWIFHLKRGTISNNGRKKCA